MLKKGGEDGQCREVEKGSLQSVEKVCYKEWKGAVTGIWNLEERWLRRVERVITESGKGSRLTSHLYSNQIKSKRGSGGDGYMLR